MYLDFKNKKKITIIPTRKKTPQKWAKWGENSSPLFYPSHPSFLCLFWIILSIRSEEVLLFFGVIDLYQNP